MSDPVSPDRDHTKRSPYFVRVFRGMGSFKEGASLLIEKRLYHYFWLPSIISLIVGTLLIWGVYELLSALVFPLYISLLESIQELTGASLPSVQEGGSWFLTIVLIIATFYVAVLLYRPLLSISVAPFQGILAERLEIEITGNKSETDWKRDVKNTMLGIFSALKWSLVTLLVLLLTFPLGPIGGLVLFLLESYVLGRGAFELVLERHHDTIATRRVEEKRYKGEALGTGALFFILLMVPIVGLIFAPHFALAGAALTYYRDRNRTLPEYS